MIRLVMIVCSFVVMCSSTLAQDAGSTETDISVQQTPIDVLSSTVQRMKGAGTDLKTGAVTKDTVAQQRRVLADLDQLIKLAQQMPKKSRGGRSRKQKNADPSSSGKQQPKPQSEPGKLNQKSPPQNGDQPPKQGIANQQTRSVGPASGSSSAERRRIMVQQIWGHLPPVLQRQLMTGENEKPLPKYERLVKKYFEALSEKSRRSKSSTNSKMPRK